MLRIRLDISPWGIIRHSTFRIQDDRFTEKNRGGRERKGREGKGVVGERLDEPP